MRLACPLFPLRDFLPVGPLLLSHRTQMMGARLPAVALGLSLATGMHPCKVPLHAPCPLYLVIGHPHRTPSLGFRGQVILLPVTQGSPPRTCMTAFLSSLSFIENTRPARVRPASSSTRKSTFLPTRPSQASATSSTLPASSLTTSATTSSGYTLVHAASLHRPL
ncbi:hypothetical protein BC826DRAFT_1049508 [Russula brevipes]|nr:hypothetical protein BC826DRAFT_1049508 [Russula brevipes]